MKILYDITIPLQNGVAVWDGDTAYHFALGWNMEHGASVNVGAVTMSLHTGTHTDAPFHFDSAGKTMDTADLSAFAGAVAVVDAGGRDTIDADVFAGVDFDATPRVLVRTGVWTDFARFPDAVPTLAPGVPEYLARNGVRLFGVDVPSVDTLDSKTLPVHHALAAGGIAILESIDLRGVPVGVYKLVALPLRLAGADAAPVRAVLLEARHERD